MAFTIFTKTTTDQYQQLGRPHQPAIPPADPPPPPPRSPPHSEPQGSWSGPQSISNKIEGRRARQEEELDRQEYRMFLAGVAGLL
ncbi:hypothetical protein FSARC_13641 [Fusarium sarcochroum]|uniref:Uncharacterized protein n=1 Tax=Fusarium sarcochroum TaxID=1208366 RepID=A0A8H4WSY2_9HYPO|nr:hypothetical protein FSARC_13641 [Fusarium sarcochroum]